MLALKKKYLRKKSISKCLYYPNYSTFVRLKDLSIPL